MMPSTDSFSHRMDHDTKVTSDLVSMSSKVNDEASPTVEQDDNPNMESVIFAKVLYLHVDWTEELVCSY